MQVDQLGRIVLPKEMRRSLNIETGEPLDIYLREGIISIEKCKLQCAICGSSEENELLTIDGIHICRECATKVHSVWESKK
ncbi:hypothetical protein CG709_01530 [Lachnotalea glycerini]|nr:hypothetical protein CG709_01530 [Lachnotalea glycerini]